MKRFVIFGIIVSMLLSVICSIPAFAATYVTVDLSADGKTPHVLKCTQTESTNSTYAGVEITDPYNGHTVVRYWAISGSRSQTAKLTIEPNDGNSMFKLTYRVFSDLSNPEGSIVSGETTHDFTLNGILTFDTITSSSKTAPVNRYVEIIGYTDLTAGSYRILPASGKSATFHIGAANGRQITVNEAMAEQDKLLEGVSKIYSLPSENTDSQFCGWGIDTGSERYMLSVGSDHSITLPAITGTTDYILFPAFTSDSNAALWQAGGKNTYFFDDAVYWASISASEFDRWVILKSTGSLNLLSGNSVTVPQNVTVLLSFDESAAGVQNGGLTISDDSTRRYSNADWKAGSTYTIRTIKSPYVDINHTLNVYGCQITCFGKWVIGGVIQAGNNYLSGSTYGKHCNMKLDSASTLLLKSGSILSVCGYILGEGNIVAEAGSEVYEPFIIGDFNGGGYTVGAAGKIAKVSTEKEVIKKPALVSEIFVALLLEGAVALSGLTDNGLQQQQPGIYKDADNAVTPFNIHTLQNIQVHSKIEYGCTVYGYCVLAPSGDMNNCCIKIVGTSDALVILKDPLGSLEYSYEGITWDNYSGSTINFLDINEARHGLGTSHIQINGSAEMGSVTLTIVQAREVDRGSVTALVTATANIELKSVVFPIPYCYHVVLNGGTHTINSDVNLLPGASLTVNPDTTLNIGKRFAVFDGLAEYFSSVQGAAATASAHVYPATPYLESRRGDNGMANLYVDGTLHITSGANFGGYVQSGDKGTGKFILDAIPNVTLGENETPANAKVLTQVGAIGHAKALSKDYYYAGATTRTYEAKLYDGTRDASNNLNFITLVPGRTYYSRVDDIKSNGVVYNYSFELYNSCTTDDSAAWGHSTKTVAFQTVFGGRLKGAWYAEGEVYMDVVAGTYRAEYHTAPDMPYSAAPAIENYTDGDYIYRASGWDNGTPGARNVKIYYPTKADDTVLNVMLYKEDGTPGIDVNYRLDSYIWLNASFHLGEIAKNAVEEFNKDISQVNFCNVNVLINGESTIGDEDVEGAELIRVGDTFYLVRKILSTDLSEEMTYTLEYQIEGIPEKTFTLEKTILFDDYEIAEGQLKTSMTKYARAAYDYFMESDKYAGKVGLGWTLDKWEEYYMEYVNADENGSLKSKVADAIPSSTQQGISIPETNNSISFTFDECIRLNYKFPINLAEGYDTGKILQVGILYAEDRLLDSQWVRLKEGTTDEYLYVCDYAVTKDNCDQAIVCYQKAGGDSVNNPSTPGIPGYQPSYIDYQKTLEDGRQKVTFDLKVEDYMAFFAFRPFVVTEDGIIYGQQYNYSLMDYCYKRLCKSNNSRYKVLMYHLSDYARTASAILYET